MTRPITEMKPLALAIAAALSAAISLPLAARAGEGDHGEHRDRGEQGDRGDRGDGGEHREHGMGRYVAGDFHNHTTCSDGSISMQKLVKKATDKTETPWGLDWFVQAGHGNSGGSRNCTLVEDSSLDTPLYPAVTDASGTVLGPNTTWANSIGAANVKGDGNGPGGASYMWRWQSIQEYQYPVLEYLAAYKHLPLFIGTESIVPGHEHSSMSVITGQMPDKLNRVKLPTTPGPLTARYSPLGNANALAQWNYCFDLGDTDLSRGNVTGSTVGNNWDCAVPGSNSSADPSWNAAAHKLVPTGSGVGSGIGTKGHLKTVEAMKWMAKFNPDQSYYVPAHLERAGPFTPDGNQGFNVEHLRDFNNAAPRVAFGMESQPGHGAANNRGEYQIGRNTFPGVTGKVDSVGGTTYGGTGVYAGYVGGVWDAMLGEGRNFWFFASSDWHSRGLFGPDDRRSTFDFYPGEYQRDYVMVRDAAESIRPQAVVDGLRSGNSFTSSGQLIDRLAFVACAVEAPERERRGSKVEAAENALVEAAALKSAVRDTDVDFKNCASMGEKLTVKPGSDIIVAIVARDPSGPNFSPYTFLNPSLAQVGMSVPLNMPVLDHIDVIDGQVTGYRQPGAADYAGAWPNTWASNPDIATVPAAAKNVSTAVIKTFAKGDWRTADGDFVRMVFRVPAVKSSQYLRLRGTNMPAAVPYETDANGNPLADVYTNAFDTTKLAIPCTTPHSADSQFDGCPDHLAVASGASPIAGLKAVSYDVAAWADLWFYSNPIFVEVTDSVLVAGVK